MCVGNLSTPYYYTFLSLSIGSHKTVEIPPTIVYHSAYSEEVKTMITDIGERIKMRREELNMSQDELARAAGYKSRSSINKIEVDGRGLPQKKIVAIANALRVTPAYLMGWEDEEDVRTIQIPIEEERLLTQIRQLTKTNQYLLKNIIQSMIDSQKGSKNI